MIKPFHLLISILIGFGLGILVMTCGGKEDALIDPEIHRLKEEIGWSGFKEAKFTERIHKDSLEKIALAKDVIYEKQKTEKAEHKFQNAEHHYAEVRKMVPLTHKDTIGFLVQDTVACDSALLMARYELLEAKELSSKMAVEMITDNILIQNLDSLNVDLRGDKKKMLQVDSLNQIKNKKLTKNGRKKFLKGLGVGGAIVALLVIIF